MPPTGSTQDLARTPMQLCMDLGGTRLYIVLLSEAVGFNPFPTMRGRRAIRFPAIIHLGNNREYQDEVAFVYEHTLRDCFVLRRHA